MTSLHWRVHLDGPAMPLAKSRKESTLSKRNRGRPTTNDQQYRTTTAQRIREAHESPRIPLLLTVIILSIGRFSLPRPIYKGALERPKAQRTRASGGCSKIYVTTCNSSTQLQLIPVPAAKTKRIISFVIIKIMLKMFRLRIASCFLPWLLLSSAAMDMNTDKTYLRSRGRSLQTCTLEPILSEAQFNALAPNRVDPPYSYQGLCDAVTAWNTDSANLR